MAMEIIRKTREVVDGVEYNVTYLKGTYGTSTVYDPVRTPEQQAKRDETLRQAAADYAKACIRTLGIEWAREHLLVYADGENGMDRTADCRGDQPERAGYSPAEAR